MNLDSNAPLITTATSTPAVAEAASANTVPRFGWSHKKIRTVTTALAGPTSFARTKVAAMVAHSFHPLYQFVGGGDVAGIVDSGWSLIGLGTCESSHSS